MGSTHDHIHTPLSTTPDQVHAEIHTPVQVHAYIHTSVNRMTHACENISFHNFFLREVIIVEPIYLTHAICSAVSSVYQAVIVRRYHKFWGNLHTKHHYPDIILSESWCHVNPQPRMVSDSYIFKRKKINTENCSLQWSKYSRNKLLSFALTVVLSYSDSTS